MLNRPFVCPRVLLAHRPPRQPLPAAAPAHPHAPGMSSDDDRSVLSPSSGAGTLGPRRQRGPAPSDTPWQSQLPAVPGSPQRSRPVVTSFWFLPLSSRGRFPRVSVCLCPQQAF